MIVVTSMNPLFEELISYSVPFPTPLPSLAAGTVPDPRLEALSAVKLTPLDAGIVAGGVSVDALVVQRCAAW